MHVLHGSSFWAHCNLGYLILLHGIIFFHLFQSSYSLISTNTTLCRWQVIEHCRIWEQYKISQTLVAAIEVGIQYFSVFVQSKLEGEWLRPWPFKQEEKERKLQLLARFSPPTAHILESQPRLTWSTYMWVLWMHQKGIVLLSYIPWENLRYKISNNNKFI